MLLHLAATAAWCQIPIVLPDKSSVRVGETVTFLHQLGEPFRHRLQDATVGQELIIVSPDGKATTYPSRYFQSVTLPHADKKVQAYRFAYRPEQRGDYLILLKLPEVWLPDDDLGQRVHAIVQASGDVDADALRAHLRERIVHYAIPRTFEFVDRPLRDEAGKVQRWQLRQARIQRGGSAG